MLVKHLTIEQVVFLHDEIIKKTGGSLGVRDWNLIHSAVFRPQASFAGKDLYEDIFKKAGALWQSLTKNHGFVDGNKRTAALASFLFLEINHIAIEVATKELVDFSLKAENQNLAVETIAVWLQEHAKSA